MAGPKNRLEDPEWTERIDKLIGLIRSGMWVNVACNKVGLTKKTFYKWLDDGRNNKSPAHVEFLRRVEEATADCEIDVIKTIVDICKKNEYIPGLIWFAERKFGNNWAAPAQQVRVVQQIEDQLDAFIKKTEEALGPELAAKVFRHIVENPEMELEVLDAKVEDISAEMEEVSEDTQKRILTHLNEQ